jgi:hypothetical protein
MDDAERPDPAVLRSTCEESRAVLDERLAKLEDIGDKAIWTVRSAILVLGLVVSAASLGDPATLRRLHAGALLLAALGTLSLLAACVFGLGTYFGMHRVTGIGSDYRRFAASESLTETTWLLAVLRGYDDWILDVERATDRSGTHLLRAQLAFLAGVLSLVSAGILSLATL